MGLQHDAPADPKATWEYNLTNHTPTAEGIEKIEALRAAAKAYVNAILDNTPYSREQSLALTSAETSLFHANSAVARNFTEDKQ
jgi:hypothetical protein